ncbi:hypothetical protein, partial [Chelativorans composti]
PRWRHDHHCTNNQIGPVRGGRSRAAADRLYCYRDLVDEHIDKAERAYAAGETATEFVQWFGEKYDLIPASSLRTF